MVGLWFAAYFLGSIPIGFLAGLAKGIDLRKQGSGNIGATNAGRVLGWKIGLSVFALDFLKGAIPTALALKGFPVWVAILAGMASFFGHLFPVWLRFQGGKGVATAGGITAVILPGPFLASLAIWILFLLAWRMVSLASLAAAGTLIATVLVEKDPFGEVRLGQTLLGLVSGLGVLLTHTSNIRRILAGTENQIKPSGALSAMVRILHIGSMGAWVGIGWFFTLVIGLGIFATFSDLTSLPDNQRPWWLPVPVIFDQAPPSSQFPDPLRKEQGSLLAGQAVSAVFPTYYEVQVWLALASLLTAVVWQKQGRMHRIRVQIIGVGLLLVICGWAFQKQLTQMRLAKTDSLHKALLSKETHPIQEAGLQRAKFNHLHGFSILLNLVTLIVATAGLGFAGFLPVVSSLEKDPKEN